MSAAAVRRTAIAARSLPWLLATTNLVLALDNRRYLENRRHLDDRGHLARFPDAPPPVVRAVWVLLPARNEEQRIGQIIDDLRGQQSLARFTVAVLDDASSDRTAEIARAAIDGDDRFILISSSITPPAGHNPKVAALAQLVDALEERWATEDLLLFVDADVRLSRRAVAGAVALFEAQMPIARAGLLSVWPAQVAEGAIEQLLQPLLCWSWLCTLPLRFTERSLRRSTAVANGQLLVTTVDAYRRVGGHRAVAASAAEDLALARRYRDHGLYTAVRVAPRDVRCRMYHTPAAVWHGYRRWLATEFGGPAGAVLVAAVATSSSLLPVVDVIRGRHRLAAGWALGATTLSRLVARHTECAMLGVTEVGSALAHPVAMGVVTALVVDSVRARRRGRLSWKQRAV